MRRKSADWESKWAGRVGKGVDVALGWWFAWVVCALLYVMVPWPAAKYAAGCAFLMALGLRRRGRERLAGPGRLSGRGALAGLFALAYLVSPYWQIGAGAGGARVAIVYGLLALGLGWAWMAGGGGDERNDSYRTNGTNGTNGTDGPDGTGREGGAKGEGACGRGTGLGGAMIGLAVLAANFLAMGYDIPFGGDELHHIDCALKLRAAVAVFVHSVHPLAGAIVLVAVIAFLAWLRRPAVATVEVKFAILGAVGLGVWAWRGFAPGEVLNPYMLRYPLAATWLTLPALGWSSWRYEEGLYRLVPMLSVFGMAWFGYGFLRRAGARWFVAGPIGVLVFALTPNIYYHSTILYLELPMVALLTVAMMDIEPIILGDFNKARATRGWLALMAAGFVKETAAPVVAGIILLRFVARGMALARRKEITARRVAEEAAAVFCIALPVCVYLFFRIGFGEARTYGAQWGNLWDWSAYGAMSEALWSQYSLTLLVAAGGWLFCVARRERRFEALATGFLFAWVFVIQLADEREYVGLARFDLMLFPMMAAWVLWFVQGLRGRRWAAGRWAVGLLIAALGFNLARSPVAWSGEKAPGWGQSYYPYSKAVAWLKANRSGRFFMVGGESWITPLGWYYAKLGQRPHAFEARSDPKKPYWVNLNETLAAAREKDIPLILYHKSDGPDLIEPEKALQGYRAVAVIRNRWLALVVYESGSSGEE